MSSNCVIILEITIIIIFMFNVLQIKEKNI
jgi:hypothetical protein